MIERLLITFAISVLAFGAYHLFLWYQRQRTGQAVSNTLTGDTPEALSARLLYFHSEHCGACIAQAHALEALEVHHRALIEPIDIEREPALVRQFKIMTLPTTILIDGQGRTRHFNPGLVSAARLAGQLQEL